MRRLHKWALIGSAAFVALLLVTILGISWVAGQGLLHPERERSTEDPSSVGLRWEWANFTTSDGVTIVGWWMPTDASPHDNATVFFLHGYGDSKNQSLAPARFLVANGFNVLAFDFRACGESGGNYTTAGILEVREVVAATAWLRNQSGFPDDPELAFLGWSMGGAVAIGAATHVPEVDAVIADGAYSRLQNIVDTSIVHFIKKAIGFSVPRWPIGPLSVQFASWSVGVALDEAPPSVAITRLDVPVLLIQGLADRTVLPSNVEELAKAGGAQVEVYRVEGAAHVQSMSVNPQDYEARVVDFLNRAFASQADDVV